MENNGCGFIRLENVTKSYIEGSTRRPVLNRASLCIQKGEIIAILGKSGSGKTTMLNLIGGIDLPDDGDIFLEDICLNRLPDFDRTMFRRKRIGFVFQFFNLIPTLTVWENITLPLELNGMMSGVGKARAKTLLEQVSLDNRNQTYPDRLSGGEQQRIAIARSLVHNPDIILADEPTGNLDEETGKLVMQLLSRLVRESAKTMILVTHSLEAAAYADRVLMLKEGHLTEQ